MRIRSKIIKLAAMLAIVAPLTMFGLASVASAASAHQPRAAASQVFGAQARTRTGTPSGNLGRIDRIGWESWPCQGFGGESPTCEIYFSPDGSSATAAVFNNPDYQWVFHLRCTNFGDQYSGANPSSTGWVYSNLGCNFSTYYSGLIYAI